MLNDPIQSENTNRVGSPPEPKEAEPVGVHAKALCQLALDPRWLVELLVDFNDAFTDDEVTQLEGWFTIGCQGEIAELLLQVFTRRIKEQF